jgi:hypothetical protein
MTWKILPFNFDSVNMAIVRDFLGRMGHAHPAYLTYSYDKCDVAGSASAGAEVTGSSSPN